MYLFLDYSSSRKKPMDKDTKPFLVKEYLNFINNLFKKKLKKTEEDGREIILNLETSNQFLNLIKLIGKIYTDIKILF